jgi:murein DD-endopeptidase MepM/ murein hydrolase activator NlpD
MSQRSSLPHRADDRQAETHDESDVYRHAEHAARRYAPAPQDERRHVQPRPRHSPAKDHDHRRPVRNGYTLGHGGRQVRIGPVAFWICVGTLVIMAGWSAVTATYFAFHDDVLARLIARQAAMQFAYEDRIAEMRVQVDRVTSRQLLDQEQFDRRLEQISKRQTSLEARTSSLGALTDSSITGSIKPATRGIVPRDATGPLRPPPLNDQSSLVAPGSRESRRDVWMTTSAPVTSRQAAQAMSGGVEGELVRLQNGLDRVEATQTASLNSLEESYDGKLKRMRGVLSELGLNPAARAASESAVGGPFVPYTLPAGAGPFERQIYRIAVARAQADKLTRAMTALPIRKPVMGELDASSGFGVRIDPFLGHPAMHTGIDFRGDVGEPVHATASGTITVAGWSGGYGRMVEIDHGNGLATRYGHMSQIDVSVGQAVKIGQVVGRLGSTGRSTGPHLHYETRIGGEAVDPEKFLRAGMRMGTIQSRWRSTTRSIHVLDRDRLRSERLLRQRRLHELVEVAVEHRPGVRGRHAGAQVLHHLVGLQHVGADLVAPADVGLGGLIGDGLFLALLELALVEPRAQHLPRRRPVLVLRALGLDHDRKPGRDVGETDRRFGLVDVLTAGAARAHRIGAHVGLLDVDDDAVVDHREDGDARERGMAARIGVERRDAHQAVHAAFGLEPAERVVALDLDGRRLDARLLAGGLLEIIDLVAVLLGPARVHAQQDGRPVLALGAAGAGMHLEIAVIGVGLARQQRLELAAPDLGAQALERGLGLGHHGAVVLGLAEPDHLDIVREIALDASKRRQLVVEHRAFLHQALRLLRVVPQARSLGELVQLGETRARLVDVKDASSAARLTA